MNLSDNIDPFEGYMHLFLDSESNIIVDYDILDSVTQKIDLVKYHKNYLSFIYRLNLQESSDPMLLIHVLGYSIMNSSLKKDGFNQVVLNITRRFNFLLGRTPLMKFSVDSLFRFLRYMFQISGNARIIVACLVARLSLIENDESLMECKQDIHNSVDVIQAMYEKEELEPYFEALSNSIDRVISL